MDWLGTFALHKYSSFCRQTLIGGNYGLLQNENGKYLLNPDYFAGLLFSHVMHGKILKLKNNQDNTIHQYGTINSKGTSKKFINHKSDIFKTFHRNYRTFIDKLPVKKDQYKH